MMEKIFVKNLLLLVVYQQCNNALQTTLAGPILHKITCPFSKYFQILYIFALFVIF